LSTCDAAGAAGLPLASFSSILLKAGSSGSVKWIVTSVAAATSAFAAGSLDTRCACAKAVDVMTSAAAPNVNARSAGREKLNSFM
jgi:hypothetical protein